MSKLTTIFLFLFLVWPFFLVPKSSATTPEKRSDIIKLLKMMGTAEIATKAAIRSSNQQIDILSKNKKKLTPRIIEIIRAEKTAVIIEQFSDGQILFSYLIPIYDKYYTHSEIKALISFYDSELGRKTVQITPYLMADSSAFEKKISESIKHIAFDRIIKRLETEGIKVEE